jgi:hypothetical protein
MYLAQICLHHHYLKLKPSPSKLKTSVTKGHDELMIVRKQDELVTSKLIQMKNQTGKDGLSRRNTDRRAGSFSCPRRVISESRFFPWPSPVVRSPGSQ